MKNKFFKKYKINQLQNIKQTFQYIYVFRYNDLNVNEILLLKKILKKIDYKSLFLKQTLNNILNLNTKGQGSLLIIYGNQNLNILQNFNKFKKLELIYLKNNNNIYSNLKIKKIFNNQNLFLNFLIIKPFMNFIYCLKSLKQLKANIT